MNNQKIIDNFAETRNLSPASKHLYKRWFQAYSNYNNMTLQELLNEAETEEEKGIRWKNRTLKKRLLKYRNHLTQTYKSRTAKTMFNAAKTFYRHHEIEIHQLPPWNNKQLDHNIINHNDLPDKKIILASLDIADKQMQAMILFMSSSGCARNETLQLTIKDFIEATSEYHQTENIKEVIATLDFREDIIPTFHLHRKKTNKHYITFCSPEATTHIINYLKTRIDRIGACTSQEKLFKINKDYMHEKFHDINQSLGLGKVGSYDRFRSHMLRKFHASQLYNDGCSMDYVDALQGRGKDSTHSSYFMEDPEKLKEEYVKHLPCLMIRWDSVTYKSPEYIKLESEVSEKEKVIQGYEDLINSIDKRLQKLEGVESLSDDDLEGVF